MTTTEIAQRTAAPTRTGGGRTKKPRAASRASMPAEHTNGAKVGDNAARAAAKALLDHLIRLKADLDKRITTVAELVEVL